MKGVRNGITCERIKNREELKVFYKEMKRGIKIEEVHGIEEDLSRIDKSRYCERYKSCKKTSIGGYWEKEEEKEKDKRQWARLRCGNLGE